MSAAVMKVVTAREANDCAIVALSMYLGISYENVLRAVTVSDSLQGRQGLWTRTMIRIAARLGHTLKLRKTIDLESDYGIVRLPEHAAVLRNGLIIDTDGTIWDADAFLSQWHVEPRDCQLLVEDE
jgi:hypothetical protein